MSDKLIDRLKQGYTDIDWDVATDSAASYALHPPGIGCSEDVVYISLAYFALLHELECHADRDGDCTWSNCPQLRDNEPDTTGRDCPLWEDDEEV